MILQIIYQYYIYIYIYNMCLYVGFPGGAVVKNSLADAGDTK